MTFSVLHTFRLGSLADIGILATGLAPVSAETTIWKTVRDRDTSYYPGSSGCQVFAVFDGQTAFFIGFDADDDELSLDVTLLDERWSSIQDGNDQTELFIDEFQRENSMAWSFNDNQLGHYTLRGSRRALNEVVACQRGFFEATNKIGGPYSADNSGKSDPFSD